MSDDGKTAKSQQPEGQTRDDLADAPNFQQTLKPGQGVNMTDLRVDQEIVIRLRTYAHLAHAAASWGFAGEGFWMDRAADLIEEQVAALDAAQAEIERLRSIIQSMDDTILARSELFVSDQECLFNLRDRIRRALNEGEKP